MTRNIARFWWLKKFIDICPCLLSVKLHRFFFQNYLIVFRETNNICQFGYLTTNWLQCNPTEFAISSKAIFLSLKCQKPFIQSTWYRFHSSRHNHPIKKNTYNIQFALLFYFLLQTRAMKIYRKRKNMPQYESVKCMFLTR